jgi:hypothetical protein
MKRLAASLILGLASAAFAQDASYPRCEHALAISPDAFIALYYTSELDANMAASFWADCRRQETTNLMTGLQAERQEVLGLRDAFNALADAWLELQLTRWGGGTMYSHFRNRHQTDIEAATERLVRLELSGYARTTSDVLAYAVEENWQALERHYRTLEDENPASLAAQFGFDTGSFIRDWEAALAHYALAQRKVESLLYARADLLAYEALEFIRRNNGFNLMLLELP